MNQTIAYNRYSYLRRVEQTVDSNRETIPPAERYERLSFGNYQSVKRRY